MPANASAVVFSPDNHASMGRRAVSCIIDIAFLMSLMMGGQLLVTFRYVPVEVRKMKESPEKKRLIAKHMEPVARSQAVSNIVVFLCYFILLRTMHGGTLGYRITGVRLIDASGNAPAWWPLAKRFLIHCIFIFVAMIPYALLTAGGKTDSQYLQVAIFFAGIAGAILLAYSPCARHTRRQAIHDQWSGTWVVRKRAEPLGPAIPIYRTLFMGTIPLRYLDLEAAPTAEARPAQTDLAQTESAGVEVRGV